MTRGFGSIYVTGAFTAGDLTVSLVNDTSVKISTLTALNFDINLTYDFWIGDVFTIIVDDDWSISSTPTCESVVDSSTT